MLDFGTGLGVGKGVASGESPDPPAPASLDVYILAGQSNAHGHAPVDDLTSSQQQPKSGWFYTSWHHNTSNASTTQYYSSWAETVVPGYTRGDATESTLAGSDYFGPELGFISQINGNGNIPAILKYATGATSLFDGATTSSWDTTSSPVGDCWTGFKSAISDGLSKLTSAGRSYTVKGLIWYQGESDGASSTPIGTISAKLTEFFNATLSYLSGTHSVNTTNFPIIITKPADANGNVLSWDREYDEASFNFNARIVNAYDHHGAYTNVHLQGQDMWNLGVNQGKLMNDIISPSSSAYTPADSSTALWIDANDNTTITKSGSNLTQIDDKSDQGKDVTPVSGSTIVPTANKIRRKQTLVFSGDADAMRTPDFGWYDPRLFTTPNGVHDWFLVVKPSFNNNQDAVFSTQKGPSITLIPLSGRKYQLYYAGIAIGSELATSDQDGILNMIGIRWDTDNNQVSTWLNGNLTNDAVTTTVSGGIQMNNTTMVVNYMTQYAYAIKTDGSFCESIITDATNDRQKIEGYLAHKWGLESKLPHSHPYRYTPA